MRRKSLAAIAVRAGRGLDLLGPRAGHGDIARHAFLEQELAGLDHRLAMEPGAHLAIMQRVGDGDDGHALVMRHEARTIATSTPSGSRERVKSRAS